MFKNRRLAVAVLTLAFEALSLPSRTLATERYGPLQLSGSIETQNLFRHPDIDQWSFVQQRNTLRLRLDLDVVKEGKGTLGFNLPGIRTTSFFLLLRPVYDSIYDLRPGGRQDKFPYGSADRVSSLHAFGAVPDVVDSGRIADANVNAFREAYADIELSGLPMSFRIGKQQVVWGESDQFRLLDRVNPLDLTWHLNQENFTDERKPLTMLKALYRVGDLGPIHESFLELYWGLGDWVPVEEKFLPYPWSAPIESPIINRTTCTDPNNDLTCQNFKFVRGVLFRGGDYEKNPIDNGQFGTRFVFNLPQRISLGVAYFYQRFNFDDGSSPTAVRAVDQTGPTPSIPTNNLLLLGKGTLPAVVQYPYIHTMGLTATYDDADLTAAVYRLETIYELDLPFADGTKPQLITNPSCVGAPSPAPCSVAPQVPSGLHFVSKSDMWKGLIGFDRDTPIPWLNKRKTISFSGQFFWHYMVSNPQTFIGGLGPEDHIHRWEILTTLAAFTDYFTPLGDDNPSVFVALDPVNRYNMEAGWRNTLFLTNNLLITVFQNYFIVPGYAGEVAEPWGIGGVLRKRDETGIKITRQF